MPAEDPNSEFTIDVKVSGIEDDILKDFHKQVQEVAKAITLINDTMGEQIKVLELIQKDLKDYNSGTTTLGTGGGGSIGAVHLATGDSQVTDMSSLVREVATLNRNMERVGSNGTNSLFGARGLTSGYRQWDEENSFEQSQFPGASFTFQDALRQAGSIVGGYKVGGQSATQKQLEDLHAARQANPSLPQAEDFINSATDNTSWWQRPWRQAIGHITGQAEYMGDLGAEQSGTAVSLQKMGAVAPYFMRGGVFNPSTYGFGISGIQSKMSALGQMGRFGMQFGDDQSLNPFSSGGREVFGSQLQAREQSWFGFNPFLSTGQAQQIIGSVAGMGYRSGTAENMRNTMADVTQHTNIGIGDQAAIIDKSFRWGYANLQQLADFMKNDIPVAASAARLNVGQFAAQLHQVGATLGTSQGMNPFTAMGQVTDLATGTGVDPGTAQAVMGDMGLTMLAGSIQSRQTGSSFNIGGLLGSSQNAGYHAEAVATRVRQMTGMTPEQIAQLQEQAKTDPNAKRRLDGINSTLYWLAQSGNGIPGANTVEEITSRWTQRGIRDTRVAGATRTLVDQSQAQYNNAFNAYVDKHGTGFHDILNAANAGDKALASWSSGQDRKSIISSILTLNRQDNWDEDVLGKILGHHSVSDMRNGRGATREILGDASRSTADIVKALRKQLADQTKNRENTNSSAQKVTIQMAPGLAQLFKAVVTQDNTGYTTGNAPVPPTATP